MTPGARIVATLGRLEAFIAGSCLLLLLFLSLSQIVARNFFDTGFPWADTLSRHLVLYVTFFGAALAVREDRHIRIDLVIPWSSDRLRHVLYRVFYIMGAVITGFLCYAAIRFWQSEWEFAVAGERWSVILGLVLPFGFGLLAFHFILLAFGITGTRRGHPG